jgi:hypothetical protein
MKKLMSFPSPNWIAGAVIALMFTFSASSASAEEGGIFGRSGRTPGQTCALSDCHGTGSGGSAAFFTMTPVNPNHPGAALGYIPGAKYDVTVSVTGGPLAMAGFNFDADAGTGRVTDSAHTKKNSAPTRPSEFSHNAGGRRQSSWSFEWTAPSALQTVNFWLMGNSTDGDGSENGDAPTQPVTMQLGPVAPEILSRFGTVNAAVGDPVPVLFVNGSRGDDSRTFFLPTGTTPMELSIATYPGAPVRIPYAVYALRRANRAADLATIPGVGKMCFAIPLNGGSPVTLLNTIGREPQLGVPRITGSPLGPAMIFRMPRVPANVAGASITLQGVLPDSTATSGGAITNAVVVTFQ